MTPGSSPSPHFILSEPHHIVPLRHLPLVGIFPRISDIIGLHHYQYYVKDIGIDMVRIANHTAAFASKARLWSDESAGSPPT